MLQTIREISHLCLVKLTIHIVATRAQNKQSHFKLLPFAPAKIICLGLAEILSEKIRACDHRNNAREIHGLGRFATRPLDQPVIRRLVILKLWQAGDTFDPPRSMQKLTDGPAFDWDELPQLLNCVVAVDCKRICADCDLLGYRWDTTDLHLPEIPDGHYLGA